MRRVESLLLAASVCGIVVVLPSAAKPEYLKKVPNEGEIPYGKVVYVDDKTCPKGEVKEITGGSREKKIPRKTRCIKRPRD